MGSRGIVDKGFKSADSNTAEAFNIGDIVELRRGCAFVEIILEEFLGREMYELGLDPEGPLKVAWVDWQANQVMIEANEEYGLVIESMLLRPHWYH